jgi:F-type H+-transporting ATPase subunit b
MADTATTESPGHGAPQGAGGLPQFDASWWPGEMVWFLIIFVVVFALMAKVFAPRVGGTIAEREERISGDIARARMLKEQAEAQAAAADAEIAQARAQGQKLASEAKARAQAEAAARQAAEEAKLNETLGKAEASIRESRDRAMGQVGAIAAETAQAIVAKLSGQAASTAEIQSALAGRA